MSDNPRDGSGRWRGGGQHGAGLSPDQIAWHDRRLSALENRAGEVERRAEEVKAPMREALSQMREWQAAAIEREKRREEQVTQLREEIAQLRRETNDGMKSIKELIPNKAINDLIVKAVLGLITLIVIAVVTAWLSGVIVKR